MFNPDGSFAYRATGAAVQILIDRGKATVSGRRKAYAVRLVAEFIPAQYDSASHTLDRSSLTCASRVCVNARELLAPSPRQDFGWEKALTLQQKRNGYTTNKAGQVLTAAGKLTAAYRRSHASW